MPREGLTPAQRTLRAQLAAYTLHSTRDARETTAAARDAFWNGFLDLVDPDHILPEPERLRRAEAARRAHFTRMRLERSRKASQGKKQTTESADPVASEIEEVAGAGGEPSD